MVDGLTERLDPAESLMIARALPVLAELVLMVTGPLDDEPQGSRRQLAGEDGERVDVKRCLVVAVGRMEVRPATVMGLVVVHPYDDPVERADPWHGGAILPSAPVASSPSSR